MSLNNNQLKKKMIEFMRNDDPYVVVVVSNQYVSTVRDVCLSDGWIEVPRGVAQPLGALIDLSKGVDYDSDVDDFSYSLGLTAFHTPINDQLYKIVDDEDLPVERGVEDGLYSVFLKPTKRFIVDNYCTARSSHYFNEVVDGVKQKTDRDFQVYSLHIVTDGHNPDFFVDKQIRYNEIVNKYLRDSDFAFNRFQEECIGGKRAKYTSDLGNTCYMGIDFIDNGIDVSLQLYLNPDEFDHN